MQDIDSIKMALDYDNRLRKYNKEVSELREQRNRFLKENPNHPFKDTMYIQVIAPPIKGIVRVIK